MTGIATSDVSFPIAIIGIALVVAVTCFAVGWILSAAHHKAQAEWEIALRERGPAWNWQPLHEVLGMPAPSEYADPGSVPKRYVGKHAKARR